MKDLVIGVHIVRENARSSLEGIVLAEEMGIDAAWMTLGGPMPDSLPILAAAAVQTAEIKLGTCIVPTFPRHPLAMAQSAKALAQLAHGRFRLGIGPSHGPVIEDAWGIPFRKPLSHLREYLQILKAALQRGGKLEYSGEFFNINTDWGQPSQLPIMISALQKRSFQTAGEMADGAISWVCPLEYLVRQAIPALERGAARAGRARPAMVMHLGLCVHDDESEAIEAGMRQFGAYPRLPFYRQMFLDAGFPEAAEGRMSEAMLRSILYFGNESKVEEQIRRLAPTGVDEVICTIASAGKDTKASIERAWRLLAGLSKRD